MIFKDEKSDKFWEIKFEDTNDDKRKFIVRYGKVDTPGSSAEPKLDTITNIKKLIEAKKVNYGFDASVGEYVDMIEKGIIDPAKVVRVALENASSVAGMLLTTECVISNIKEENPAPMPPMGGGGMPGMM